MNTTTATIQYAARYVKSLGSGLRAERLYFLELAMKQILLTKGKVAIADDTDFEWLSRWKWFARKKRNSWYAMRNSRGANGRQTLIRMHREILGLKHGDGIETDHKDGNGLNNQRNNLRIATGAQNQHNRKKGKGTSQFKGVSWHKKPKRWLAAIKLNKVSHHIGCYKIEIEAAKAYDRKARELYGDFARCNFPAIESGEMAG